MEEFKLTSSQKKQINATFSKFMFFNCVCLVFEQPIQRENFLTYIENTPIGGSPLAHEEIFVSRMYNGAERFVYFFPYKFNLVYDLIYGYFDKYPMQEKKGGIML